jgi:hypothetical protein
MGFIHTLVEASMWIKKRCGRWINPAFAKPSD